MRCHPHVNEVREMGEGRASTGAGAPGGQDGQGMGPFNRVPLSSMRKTIIRRLSESERDALRVTVTMEVDMSRATQLHEELLQAEAPVRVSYTDIIIKATVDALKDHPLLNSRLEGDAIQIFDKIHMGVAIALDQGLIVPVIRDADEKPLLEIAQASRALIDKARRGALTLGDVAGGTFTITNLGSFGVDIFTPILNPPQSAILAVGRIAEKPVVVDGAITIRRLMPLSLSFDHRVCDGAEAARFLQRVKACLEDPAAI